MNRGGSIVENSTGPRSTPTKQAAEGATGPLKPLPTRKQSRFVLTLLAAIILGMCGAPLWGQIEVGRLTGTVTDQTGSVINGATVTLTNNATGISATQTTAGGIYTFTAVQAGTYTLTIEGQGFTTHITNDVVIHVQQIETVDAQLTPGKVSEHVVVTSTAPLLQTESAEVGETIGTMPVNDMPLNGRQWSSLGLLAPGVNTASPGHTNSDGALATPSDRYYSVNGQAVGSNDFRLNGLSDMAAFFNSNAVIQPPPDAIQEFKITTGDFNAEIGHGIGGVVNAVLKSGTNRFHGDLWNYFRNNAMDARDYFTAQSGASLPELRQNQFGGAVGGPVYIPHVYDGRNKTFFFFDIQELKSIGPDQVTANVPTDLMQSSNFTNLQDMLNPGGTNVDNLARSFPFGTVLDPATTRAITCGVADSITGLLPASGSNQVCNGVPAGTPAGYVRDPFFNGQSIVGITDYTSTANMANLNILPAGRFDSNALTLLKLFPGANNPAGSYINGNNYFKNYRATNSNPQLDLRIDHNFGTKDILNGFYDQQKTDNVTPDVFGGVLQGGGYTTIQNVHSGSGSYTHVFTNTLTNEFRLGYTKESLSSVSSSAYTLGIPAQFGIQGIPQVPGNGGLPVIGISGLAQIGPGQWNPTFILQHDLQIIDNVSKIKGKHVIKVGVDINSLEGDIFQPPWGRGELDFNGNFTDVPTLNNGTTGIAQFLLNPIASTVGGTSFIGGPSDVLATSANWTRDHRWYNGIYVNDSYKVTPTLTFELGLRWDVFTPYQDVNGHQANFVPNNGNGPGGAYYIPESTCGASSSPAFEPLLAQDGITTVCSSGLGTGTYSKKNFAPRVGFAKRITPKYVLRAGFGIAYGSLDSVGYGPNIGQNYPFYYTVSYTAINDVNPLRFPDPVTGTLATLETGLSPINPTNVHPHGLGLISRYPFDQPTPYSETYNLSNQYEFTHNDSITLAYVGSVSRHLTTLLGDNAPSQLLLPGTPLANAPGLPNFVPFPDFAQGASFHSTTGMSAYNSAQLNYEHRFSFGLQTLANYVFARCLSDGQPQEGGVGSRGLFLPGFGQRGDYSNCVEGVKNTVHFSGTYRLPYGAGMRWQGSHITNAILGGWQLNWIYSYQSGNWFTVGCAQATTSGMGCNADLIGSPHSGTRNVGNWLNAAAFANPTIPTAADATATGVLLNQQDFALLGNRGFNVAGPSWYNLDASFFKEFHLDEVKYFQFRAEAFNALNNPQFSNPGNLNFLSPNNFGQITSVRNTGREMQLALKFIF